MKRIYIVIAVLISVNTLYAEEGKELEGEYTCKPWCTLSYEAIKIEGGEFTHTRVSDMICTELPCDPWSDDFPISGAVETKSNKVYLLNEKYKSGKLKMYHVDDVGGSYLLTRKEYKKWKRGKSLDAMGLHKSGG